MAGRGRCTSCGAINRTDAAFCTQCFTRGPVVATETSTAPSLAMTAPVLAPAGMDPFVAPGFAHQPVATTSPPARNQVVWKWQHLWAFGFAAWGLPRTIGRTLGTDASLSTLVDRSMLISILGYLLGALVLFALVRNEQKGDWSTLGLGRLNPSEMAGGAVFGLTLLGVCAAFGMLMNEGRYGLDPLVKLLVGGASGPGLVLLAIVVVIGAPVIEEIYFRGLMFEKLRRRNVWLAVAVTAVLFMLAHGAVVIALLAMGIALALMRRTKTLWFTIGAHASWNLAIIMVAAFTLFGNAITFGSATDPFSVTYPSTWETSEEARRVYGKGPDLALASARGSFAMFSYERTRQPSAQASLSAVVDHINKSGVAQGLDQTEIMPTDVDFSPLGAEGYEVGYMAPGLTREQPYFTTLLVIQKPGEKRLIVGEFRCVRSTCMDDVHDHEEMLTTIRLNTP